MMALDSPLFSHTNVVVVGPLRYVLPTYCIDSMGSSHPCNDCAAFAVCLSCSCHNISTTICGVKNLLRMF